MAVWHGVRWMSRCKTPTDASDRIFQICEKSNLTHVARAEKLAGGERVLNVFRRGG